MNPIKAAQKEWNRYFDDAFYRICGTQGGFIVGKDGTEYDNFAFRLKDIKKHIHSRDRAILQAVVEMAEGMKVSLPNINWRADHEDNVIKASRNSALTDLITRLKENV